MTICVEIWTQTLFLTDYEDNSQDNSYDNPQREDHTTLK